MNRLTVSVWNLAFWMIIVCQATILPATLGLGIVSRVANIAALALFSATALHTLTSRHCERVAAFYLLPALLVTVGFLINIFRGADVEALSHLGLVLPWVALLSVPFMRHFDWTRYWHYFHYFMFWASVVALVEYAGVIGGWLTPTLIKTDLGIFQKGVFTIFHSLDDESIHFRLYGVFPEPGTYAMFLLPAISYALIMGRKLALVVYLACLVFTGSLGGFIGLALLLAAYVIWLTRGKGGAMAISLMLGAVVLAVVFAAPLYEATVVAYEGRGASASIREANVRLFVENVLPTLATEPWGFPLHGQAYSALEGRAFYFGSNFSLASATVTGGLLGFAGYLGFIIMNMVVWFAAFLHRRATGIEACALLCLPALVSFVVQRATIFESALYAYLFAPLVLESLRGRWMTTEKTFMRSLDAMSRETR